MQGAISIAVLLGGVAVIYITVFATDRQNNLYYVGLLLVLMYSFTLIRLRFIYAAIVCLILLLTYIIVAAAVINLRPQLLAVNIYYLISAYFIGAVSGYRIERYIRRDFVYRRQLEVEKEKSDRLLLNILPKSFISRIPDPLPEPMHVVVDSFPDVTILFADLVNFTELAARMTPRTLVECLHEIFSLFDDLAEKHKLEKIKTIGDQYMVAGGLPETRVDHAHAVAEMALDIKDELPSKLPTAREGMF
ncbi:MAG: hypothetical protein ICV68_02065, partial [Pyrinomonadaceae bacterium]|nr:hypothetical protein [Pyrinomonadaceae bacterium]